MGIPGFIPLLQSYAQTEKLKDVDVVIDGPTLAYHVLFACKGYGYEDPSYRMLGVAVIQWLDELAKQRINIKHIYFDGNLPLWKLSERMNRATRKMTRLTDFRAAHAGELPVRDNFLNLFVGDELLLDIIAHGPSRADHKRPEPAFLVPAVLDGLRGSPRYKSLFSVVAGEADGFCANHVHRSGGIVITSDSDLLAHDLGHGKVAFLKDMRRDVGGGISCSTFCPRDIYKRLGIPSSTDPWRLAYEKSISPTASLPRLIEACIPPVVDRCGYDEFSKQYRSDDASLPWLGLSLDDLDPRVSECLLQLKQAGHHSLTLYGDPHPDAKFFLPALMEDPGRGNAWEPSTPIRRLAYSLAAWNFDCPPNTPVFEFRRVSYETQKGRQVDSMSWDSLQHAIKLLSLNICHVQRAAKGIDECPWTLLCLALIASECEEQGKYCHVWQMLCEKNTSSLACKRGAVSWDVVHATAQLQAAYYSLRILSQTLAFFINEEDTAPLPSFVLDTYNLLTTFPLASFPDIQEVHRFLDRSKAKQKRFDVIQSAVDIVIRT